MAQGKKEDPAYEKWLTEDGLMLVECWARDGLTNAQIAFKMGMSEQYFCQLKKRFPQLKEATRKGKEIVDYQVENALLKLALGFETKEVKTIISGSQDKNGNRPVRMETTVKQVAPNVTAIAMWLNNRKPDQWKRNRDNVLELNDEDSRITVNIVKHEAAPDNSKSSPKQNDEAWNVESDNVPDDADWPDDFEE